MTHQEKRKQMKKNSKFIWVNKELYKDYEDGKFCIAEFTKEIETSSKIKIEISANARYLLFVNGEYVGRGPTSVGGDFLNGKIEESYYEVYEINKTGKLQISALVTSCPTALNEYNFGFSGLYIRVTNEEKEEWSGDDSWNARILSERLWPNYTDYTKKENPYSKACKTEETLDLILSPLSQLAEDIIYPQNLQKITVESGKSAKECLFFDKIYSAYPQITVKCDGKCTLKMTSSEEGKAGRIAETIIFDRDKTHLCPRMRSIGQIELEIINEGNSEAIIDLCIKYVRYPIYSEGKFTCSDKLINKIYDVCMHSLKICRQTIHLDSPTHQEPLACTGDYYIQSMIEYLSLGDFTLAELDIIRTAKLLKVQNGRLFHTTYSLIYPWWVYDHYMHTGNKDVIDLEALGLLLSRFDTYISSENGLVEYAPDYMFVDWVVASCENDSFLDGGNMMSHGKMEGFSLHHPPKALGQSVLCMFYYNALVKSAELYRLVNDEKSAKECLKKAEILKNSINTYLFDSEKGLYIGGLNTDNLVSENEWLPKNTKNVYYLKQANTLAVLFGIAPKELRSGILEYVCKDLTKLEMQPYFYFYLLNALYNENMLEEYGFSLIRRYESIINKCDKGLSEAWENMDCDYSHSWGAAPAYVLKRALSGIEMLEPAFKKIKLKPQLFDLEKAELEIVTPYGKIQISIKKGEDVSIKAPREIEII